MTVRVSNPRRCADLHRALGEAHREIERLNAALAAETAAQDEQVRLLHAQIEEALIIAGDLISAGGDEVDVDNTYWHEACSRYHKVHP